MTKRANGVTSTDSRKTSNGKYYFRGKWETIASGALPYKDAEPRPVARITFDKNAIFGRGADGRWKWLRLGHLSGTNKMLIRVLLTK